MMRATTIRMALAAMLMSGTAGDSAAAEARDCAAERDDYLPATVTLNSGHQGKYPPIDF